MKPFWLAGLAAVALLSVPSMRGQSVISARSGLVHYAEGDVFLADQKIDPKVGNFPEVKEKAVLRSELGRAEVLLNPGVFLRLAENSAFRMITNRLIDTRVDLMKGSFEVEALEITKDTGVTIVSQDAQVTMRKAGLYRFDSNPARLRVFAGEAQVALNGQNLEVSAGKTVAFEGESAGVVAKFDKTDTDALDRWSRRRGEMVAMANVSAAKSLHDSGTSLYSSTWRWNPYLGMMTFIPSSGMLYSPYGYSYWSPISVYRAYYQPQPVWNGGGGGYNAASNGGYMGMSPTSGGYSGTSASMATSSAPAAVSNSGSTSAAAAPSSSVGHGGGGGGGRQH